MSKHKRQFLVALPIFPGSSGFCHKTILVAAINSTDAVSLVRYLKPCDNIGDIKEVVYTKFPPIQGGSY